MSEKCRSFGFICYPDSTEYDFASLLEKASMLFDEYGYILHDQDLDQDGVFLKPHYHFYGRFKNPRSISSISKELNLSVNQIDIVKSFKGAIRYLVHLNEPDKEQYDIVEIQTNIQNLRTHYFGQSEAEFVITLINLRIEGYSIKELVLYSLENDCYSVFRRNYRIIMDARIEFVESERVHEKREEQKYWENRRRIQKENEELQKQLPEGFEVCLDDIPF